MQAGIKDKAIAKHSAGKMIRCDERWSDTYLVTGMKKTKISASQLRAARLTSEDAKCDEMKLLRHHEI